MNTPNTKMTPPAKNPKTCSQLNMATVEMPSSGVGGLDILSLKSDDKPKTQGSKSSTDLSQ